MVRTYLPPLTVIARKVRSHSQAPEEAGKILDSSWGSLRYTETLRDWLGETGKSQKCHEVPRWAEGCGCELLTLREES